MEGAAISAQVPVHAQPALQFPTKGEKGLGWTLSDVVYHYWFIKRAETEKDESVANAHLFLQDVTHVLA